jgi:hypothetical protein
MNAALKIEIKLNDWCGIVFSFGHILKQVISFKDNVIIIIILIFIKGGRLDIDEHAVRYW